MTEDAATLPKLCANGDGRPVSPPSKVICRECMDKIGNFLRAELAYREGKGPKP